MNAPINYILVLSLFALLQGSLIRAFFFKKVEEKSIENCQIFHFRYVRYEVLAVVLPVITFYRNSGVADLWLTSLAISVSVSSILLFFFKKSVIPLKLFSDHIEYGGQKFKIEDLTHFEMSAIEFAIHTTKFRNHLVLKKAKLRDSDWTDFIQSAKSWAVQHPHVQLIEKEEGN